jgi:hypothetical protein
VFNTGNIEICQLSHYDILFPSIKATAYAACVINHSDLKKDSCLKEFLALKDCVQKAVRLNSFFFDYSIILTFV